MKIKIIIFILIVVLFNVFKDVKKMESTNKVVLEECHREYGPDAEECKNILKKKNKN